jgi:DNA-binding GntR family transcriptional regulator
MLDREASMRGEGGSLVDLVHQKVRDAILTGQYKPGETISEVGVASTFGVARPTARAAVERLIVEGLLVRSGRKAAVVPVFADAAIAEVYASRLLIEGYALRDLARRHLVPPDAVAANAAVRANGTSGDAAGMIDADVAMHSALVRAHGNSRLYRMHAMLMGEAHLLMAQVQSLQLLRAETIADEHATILQAIGRGSETATYEGLEYHLRHAQAKLLESRRADAPISTRENERNERRTAVVPAGPQMGTDEPD